MEQYIDEVIKGTGLTRKGLSCFYKGKRVFSMNSVPLDDKVKKIVKANLLYRLELEKELERIHEELR